MAGKQRLNDDDWAQQRDNELKPIPGITGEGAEKAVARPNSGNTGGLFNDVGDGTIGEVGERYRERVDGGGTDQPPHEYHMTSGTSISPISDLQPEPTPAGTNSDIAEQLPHSPGGGGGAENVGGMGSGTGRGRGSGTPGGVTGGDSAGISGQGLSRRSDQTGTGGGVAVSGGRGSGVGTVGGGMAPDLSSSTSGGMSGGTFGGSRESDLGGGLSGGMRSGTGADVSGSTGESDDEAEGDRQRSPRRREQHGR